MTTKNDLTAALKKHFGFDTFKGNQEAIIKNLLAGNDTFVLMPTGGGKSLCYQLPSLLSEGTAVVISPLIALMKNQVDAMRNFSEENEIFTCFRNSIFSSLCGSRVSYQRGKYRISETSENLVLCSRRGSLYFGMGT